MTPRHTGPGPSVRQLIRLGRLLFLRDLRYRYRQAFLRYLWAVARPLFAVLPLIMVGSAFGLGAEMSTREYALFASNINGGPGDMDDNGFISRVSPDGRVLDLKWIDGTDANVTLHAPKGSAVHADQFYVADINVVRVFDRTSGAPRGEWAVPGAGFLNDVAVGADRTVYVTNTGITITAQGFEPSGTAAVYRFDAQGTAQAIARGEDLNQPNGIIETPQGLVMVPVGANTVVRIGSDGDLTVLAELPQGQLDGVVVAEDGSLLVSSIGANAVYHVGSSGEVREVISETPAANIGLDVGRSRVLIPQIDANRLLIYPVDLN